MKSCLWLAALFGAIFQAAVAFQSPSSSCRPSVSTAERRTRTTGAFHRPPPCSRSSWRPLSSAAGDGEDDDGEDDSAIQWQLFQKYHNKGSWKGVWTTYDYMGDVSLETVASVDYHPADDQGEGFDVSHTIVVGATQSDCATCFDRMETKTIPVARYTPDTLAARKTRLGACGMVVGPSLLRNGAMATELVLAHGDGRVRVIFQHAPVWEKGVEPGTGPPQGLKLYRCLVSREAVRDAPPTAATEQANPPSTDGDDNPVFFRPVPPFDWHKKWSGTSWTWGPEAGNRGWSLEELEEGDSWQANMPVELWNLRLPGGLFIQTPRVIRAEEVGLLRLAWLPTTETLLRLETGVLALQPMPVLSDEDDFEVLAPPSLASLRCDVLRKVGDLEGAPSFVEQMQKEEAEKAAKLPSTAAKPIQVRRKAEKDNNDDEPDVKSIQDVLQL